VALTDSTIDGNEAELNGGGVMIFGGTLDMTNSSVAANSANGVGGGMFILEGAAVDIAGSTIAQNSSRSGGSIFVVRSRTTISESAIAHNESAFGGGVYNRFGSLELRDVTLSPNTAKANGGALINFYYDRGKVIVSASRFTGNKAAKKVGLGTGIYNTLEGDLTIDDATAIRRSGFARSVSQRHWPAASGEKRNRPVFPPVQHSGPRRSTKPPGRSNA